jgi:hypothetical protein
MCKWVHFFFQLLPCGTFALSQDSIAALLLPRNALISRQTKVKGLFFCGGGIVTLINILALSATLLLLLLLLLLIIIIIIIII